MPLRPCPRCRQSLKIPQPPAKVQCPNCKAVLRLGVPAAASVAGASKATGTKSNPDLEMSVHDLNGAPLPPEACAPFAMPGGEPAGATPPQWASGRVGGILMSAFLLLLIAAAGWAFVVLKSTKAKEEPAAPPPDVSQLDKNRALDFNQGRVNEAIEKGVDALKKEILTSDRLYHRSEMADVAPANAHLGASALAGLTLLECGVSTEDPAVQRVAESIRGGAGQIHATYALATAILFLDRLHQKLPVTDATRRDAARLGGRDPSGTRPGETSAGATKDSDRDLVRSFALRLMTCQDVDGYWGYGRKVSKDEEEKTFQSLKADKFAGEKAGHTTLSNSQFAALALWAARRHGVPVRPALEAVARAARAKQTMEGTWNYDQNFPMKDTSVCAGLIFLALERGLAEEGTTRSGHKAADPKLSRSALDDVAIKRGMDFLGKFLAKPPKLSAKQKEERRQTARAIKVYYERYENTGGEDVPSVSWTMDFAFSGTIMGADSWGDLYLLWSIERVGVIYDAKKIGGKDWYAWGSEIILANQKSGGLWEDRFPGVPDTCFALLFLKRANIAKDLTDKLRGLMGGNATAAAPGNQPPGRKE